MYGGGRKQGLISPISVVYLRAMDFAWVDLEIKCLNLFLGIKKYASILSGLVAGWYVS